MNRRLQLTWMTTIVVLLALSPAAFAQSRLYVPQFTYGGNEETQFLVANGNSEDAVVALWAFTSQGELLGQYQLGVKAHGTRAVTLGEAFSLGEPTASGWVGAVSESDGIQLTYTRIGDTTSSFEAQEWPSREVRLTVSESQKAVVQLSNPNAFAASVNLQAVDGVGNVLATKSVQMAAFSQINVPSASISEVATRVNVVSNADVIATVVDEFREGVVYRKKYGSDLPDEMALVIDGPESLGAYQVTISFDPKAVQFSAKDIEGGVVAGFDSKPLVVNIDNVAGQMTIASFQVGAHPAGRSMVARLRVARTGSANVRFGINVDEVTDLEGHSLLGSGLSVGLVRTK